MPQLLVIDQDSTMRKMLQFLLREDGYEVMEAGTAAHALALLDEHVCDLVIQEMDLPDMDGLDLCRRIRMTLQMPLIFISARSAVPDIVAGLQAGADDYLAKPFEPAEFLVRVWAALRRTRHATTKESTLKTPDFTLELLENRVILARNGKNIDLTPTEARLLHYLASNPGRTLTRDAITIKVWGYEYDKESNHLDVYIKRLRTKIEETPSEPQLLITTRRLGYKYQPSDLLRPP